MIREKTGIQVVGVLPFFDRSGLPEEDGLSLSQGGAVARPTVFVHGVKIVIVRLQYISNFTDFDPLLYEPDVELVYSTNPAEIENADMVIIPGTKNTVKDLLHLRERGLAQSISRAHAKGVQIVGMCGGYQMLGKHIYDPDGVESLHHEVKGLGLLNIETNFKDTKTTCRVKADLVHTGFPFSVAENRHGVPLTGYEIHMGTSIGDIGLFRMQRFPAHEPGHGDEVLDGSMNDNCWGSYIHGIFENDSFRRGMINDLRIKKGLSSLESGINCMEIKDRAIDKLASIVKDNIDMDFVTRLLKL
jgi:adenosylcobyric acid synthase